MCTTCSEFADVYVGAKTHLCNIHTCPCTSVTYAPAHAHLPMHTEVFAYTLVVTTCCKGRVTLYFIVVFPCFFKLFSQPRALTPKDLLTLQRLLPLSHLLHR